MRTLALLLAAVAAGCADLDVTVEAAPGANPGATPSYSWIPLGKLPPPDPGMENDETTDRLRAAFDAELALRGYARFESGTPLRLAFRTGVTDRNGQTLFGFGFSRRVPAGGRRADPTEYADVLVVLDVIEAASKARVWRGTVRTRLSANEYFEKDVSAMIAALMAKFPDPRKE
jgi:hypothetical protein